MVLELLAEKDNGLPGMGTFNNFDGGMGHHMSGGMEVSAAVEPFFCHVDLHWAY